MEGGGLLVACGLESGAICLVDWVDGEFGKEVDTMHLHLATVTRLAFRPKEDKRENHLLASCSADFSVQLTKVVR